MESLFYTISGLPIHPLVVHFAVVLLPLAAISLIAMIYMPKLKSKYSFITTVGIVLGAAATFVAKQSGEALAEKIGTPVKHADYAFLLTLAAFVLMVATLIWYRSTKGRKSRVVTPLGHGTVLIAVIVLILSVLTGHTGAQAVWNGKLPESNSAAAKATATPKATATSKVAGAYTIADVQKHSTATSCWSAINGNVYDLTKWINRHPGGPQVIKALCGKDGSSMFNGQHGGQSRPTTTLAGYKIGKFA